ncbi:MAG: response regulator [Methylococcaceae bacterium]|nr:MAG: response regulator [Methylococcaceae bacterium]
MSNPDLPNRILIVDDEPNNISQLIAVLKQNFNTVIATSGQQALLRAVEEPSPDLVLLDINMPEMDGYEVCRRLRNLNGGCNIPVIFVSSRDSLDDRLAAYDAGADDFVVKPFSVEELRRKIDIVLRNAKVVADLKQSTNEAMSVAMTALSDVGAIGRILHFFRRMFGVKTLEECFPLIFDGLKEFGLHSVVQFRSLNRMLTRNSQGIEDPREAELLANFVAHGNRVTSFRTRTAINFAHVTLLIKNMPVDNPDNYGRLKDYLALIAEGIEERIRFLEVDIVFRQLVSQVRQVLREIDGQYRDQQASIMDAVGKLNHDMEQALAQVELTESQTRELLKIVGETHAKVQSTYGGQLPIGRRLEQILVQIKAVIPE